MYKRQVQRFSLGTFVLTAFVKEWHDNVDTMCLSGCGRDDTFQILIVIIWRHVIEMSIYRISQAVVADISHDKQIRSADGFF